METIINSLYLPEHCLQGEELPSHILWDKHKFIRIEINFPKYLEIKEIYNVGQEDYKYKPGFLKIEKVKSNGYVGLVFATKKIDEHTIEAEIQFKISDGYRWEKHNKNILLFRPDIQIINTPKTININYNERTKSFEVDDKLKLKNNGRGTAIIGLVANEQSEVKLLDPPEFEDFRETLFSFLKRTFPKLKEKYPRYSEFIDNYLHILSNPRAFSDDGLREKAKEISDDLRKILDNDPAFAETFSSLVVGAYIRCIYQITEIETFAYYIRQIEKGNIILVNPTDLLEFQDGKCKFEGNILVTDLANNSYQELKISEIEFNVNTSCSIPVYGIIDVSAEGGD